MGLTESKVKDLRDKKFDVLYEKQKDVWLAMVGNAHYFARTHVTEGREPRPDDVHKALLPILEVNENLRKHQEDNRARFKHFRDYFGDYIIDKFMEAEANKK
jgi:hypothetical protein